MGAFPIFLFFSPADTGLHLVQLLHKLFIRGVNGPEKLLKVIKKPRRRPLSTQHH